jgi:predicted kinase
MRGYPGSGKSTIARQLPGVVVGRDYLREQMYGKSVLDGDGENAVTIAQQAQVRALLAAGLDVVIDDMNVNPRYLRDWAKVARDMGVEFFVYDVFTDVEECKRRDHQRMLEGGRYVGDHVIDKIAKRWPQSKWSIVKVKPKPTAEIEEYIPNLHSIPAIIVDIDGTLAHMDGRSPFDYSQVHTDLIDTTIRDLVNREHARGTHILICSGRDSSCQGATMKWLAEHGVFYDRLLMRDGNAKDDAGNKLPDWIVKLGIFNNCIRDVYDVQYVLDDRQQVVDMWRALGLKCLQVAEGNF